MHLKDYIILGVRLCICYLFTFCSSKALVGINIREVQVGEFPFVVSLGFIEHNNESCYTNFCTGTLISEKDILTASHCVTNRTHEEVRITIGSRNIREGVKYSPLWWITFNEWASSRNKTLKNTNNDVAIIRLNGTVGHTVKPAEISKEKYIKLVGHTVVIPGWGRIMNESLPEIMQAGDVTVMDFAMCTRRVQEVQRLPLILEPTYFCTVADPYILVHKGDSGGPVIHMNTIIGVSVATCPLPDISIHPGKVNIHHDIYYYRGFIRKVLKK